ncbi:hypothetical protein JCM33374_g6337 [Metschnikowia sp. JCM 33374]|nr:hypothetical protein JCM33374_g6337 [Metschnikowia sp. JCM 33374]
MFSHMITDHMALLSIWCPSSHAGLASLHHSLPQISMCKRAVERYNNEPKRARKTQPKYTQGPLDEVFGQHRAFPLEKEVQAGEDSSVYDYLESVRKEAEHDRVCHFVDREFPKAQINGYREPVSSTQPGVSPLSKEYMSIIMERLRQEKIKYQKSPQESGNAFSLDQLDFNSDKATMSTGTDAIPRQEICISDTTSHTGFFYYTKWLSGSMPETLTEWIFATFVRLDCGLDHQELAIVRALGVKAQKLREKFREAATQEVQVSQLVQSCVDMIVTVVSEYFGQKDLIYT